MALFKGSSDNRIGADRFQKRAIPYAGGSPISRVAARPRSCNSARKSGAGSK